MSDAKPNQEPVNEIPTWLLLAFWIYVIIGIAAFGHCWSRTQWERNDETMIMGSAAAGVLWPCYVSVKLWERPQTKPEVQP